MDALKVPLRGAQKAVWLVLAWHAGLDGNCYPCLDTIAAEAGISRRAVCTAISELERLKLITRDSPPGGKKSTRYHICCEAASQLTVKSLHTKEREEEYIRSDRFTADAKRQLELARAASRRNSVKDAFYRLVAALPDDAVITVPVLARELGARQPQVRADMQYLIKHRDIPFDMLGRFGRSKPNPKNFGKTRQAAVLQFKRTVL